MAILEREVSAQICRGANMRVSCVTVILAAWFNRFSSYRNYRWEDSSIGGSRPGQARVKFWSIVLIAYHYIVLQDDGAESSDSKNNRQSKARRLGGGMEFFSTHKPTACAARVACPGNLAALKPPLDSSSIFGPNMASEVISECLIFENFSGGACPQTPLACSHLSTHNGHTSLKQLPPALHLDRMDD